MVSLRPWKKMLKWGTTPDQKLARRLKRSYDAVAVRRIPDQDVVVALTAGGANMQAELTAIWANILPACKSKALPADADGQEKVKAAVANLEGRPAKKGS